MKEDNGSLSFSVDLDTEFLKKAAKQATDQIKGLAKVAKEGGDALDDMFDVSKENIEVQKTVIRDLEKQFRDLNKEIGKMAPGSAQEFLKKEAYQVAAELEAEKKALRNLEQAVRQNESAHVSMRTQLRNAREELIRMEQAGLRGTEAYRKLQLELGNLQDAYDDVSAQARVLANDEKTFQGIVSTISGLTGAFSAAQGAVGMFSGESENLQKIMLKVQSLMGITIGLQQVSETLNKDSYFSIVILTKAKEMLAIAETKVATAMGITTAAARVLMATLTLGLSVAITAAIVLMSKFASRAAEARKQMKMFNEIVVDSGYKSIATLNELSMSWQRLGDSIQKKERFLIDNAERFNELGVAVSGVNDAESMLVTNKDQFIQSLIERAQAMAALQLSAEKYKEAMGKELELQNVPQTVTRSILQGQIGKGFGKKITYTSKNPEYTKIEDEVKQLRQLGDDLVRQSADFTEKEKRILEDMGLSTKQIAEGSLAAIDNIISRLRERYREAAPADLPKIAAEIEKYERLLAKIDILGNKKDANTGDKGQDPNVKAVQEFEKSLQEQIRFADNVLQVMDIIAAKRKELLNDGSELDGGKKDALDKAESEARLKLKADTEKLLEEYATHLSRKLRLQEQFNQDMILLQRKLDEAIQDEEKAAIKGAMSNRTQQYLKDSKLSGDSEYDALLVEYRNHEEKKLAIMQEYEEKRKKALEFGNQGLVKQLKLEEANELSQLAVEELVNSPSWQKLFNNMDELAAKEISALLGELEGQFDKLSGKFNPIDLEATRKKLNEARDVLLSDNPFKAVGEALKAIFKEGANEGKVSAKGIKTEWKNLADATEASFKFVNDAIASTDFLKDAIGDVGQTAIASLTTIATVSIAVATAIKTAEKASVILTIIQAALAVIQAVASVVEGIIRAQDKKIERSIQKHKESVEQLERSYKALERSIDSALGTERYDTARKSIDNLKRQNELYFAMIQRERDKKKTDAGKIETYEDAIYANELAIQEMIERLRTDILSLDVSSAANELGDALLDAFKAGEDAAEAWGKKVDDIVGNVIRKMLIQNLVEQPVGKIINKYLDKWIDADGNFVGFGLVSQSAVEFGKELSNLGSGLSSALEGLPDDIRKYLVGTPDEASATGALSGAIKGASEESISLLSGYINAIRVNQMTSIDIQRQQLYSLSEIAYNTSLIRQSNVYLGRIETYMQSVSGNTRAVGL